VILVYAGAATNCLRFTVSFDGHKPDQVQVIRAAERGAGTDAQTVAPNLPLLGTTPVTSSGAGLNPFTWTLSRPGGATAAEAQTRIGEAAAGISDSMGDAGAVMARAQDKIAEMQARAGAIDAVRLIVTPRVLGEGGVPWIAAHQLPVPSLRHLVVAPCGPDVMIEGDVYRTD